MATVSGAWAPDGGLARQHQGVGTVEDGVGHVGGLGPGRPQPVGHRVEHLGGDDHRLAPLPRQVHDPLLDHRHLLRRQLDPQVAPGDHQAVERLDDGVEVGDRLRLLDLGDDRHVAADRLHDQPDGVHVGRLPHERQGDKVDPEAEGEGQVVDVLGGHGRGAEPGAGQVHALVVRQRATLDHPAGDVPAVGGDGLEPDEAVVDEERVARDHVAGQVLVGHRRPLAVALAGLGRDGEDGAGLQDGGAAVEAAEADLGALEVGQHADRPSYRVGGLAHCRAERGVIVVGAMGEVEPGHVHPRLDQLPDGLDRARGRPEGADDLGAAKSCRAPSRRSCSCWCPGSCQPRLDGLGVEAVAGDRVGHLLRLGVAGLGQGGQGGHHQVGGVGLEVAAQRRP